MGPQLLPRPVSSRPEPDDSARHRLIPIIVATPLFLQNLDTSVMATAVPSMARSLQTQPLLLNLAITSYLLSLAVFLPLSGWLAQRFGARRMFCWAIFMFSLGSALCGAATSLSMLVVFRIVQGMGGAMMIPVGRLILLRSIPASRIVAAMVWYTVPPGIGRVLGPLFGGAVVSWTSWRWIFFVNLPFGLLGIAAALYFIAPLREDKPAASFDATGFALMATGLVGLLGSAESVGRPVAGWIGWTAACIGVLALLAYWKRSRRMAEPLIDLGLLRYFTYRTSIVGGMPLRIALGASPFLLPLLFQIGFGLDPLDAGLLAASTAVGGLATRGLLTWAIRRFGFRRLLPTVTIATSLGYMSYGLFRPTTPHAVMVACMLFGGLFNSMCLVVVQTLGFAEVPRPLLSHATTLSSMAQQVSVSLGVMMAASLVAAAAWWRSGSASNLTAIDFSPAFFAIGAITLISAAWFTRLKDEHGAELR